MYYTVNTSSTFFFLSLLSSVRILSFLIAQHLESRFQMNITIVDDASWEIHRNCNDEKTKMGRKNYREFITCILLQQMNVVIRRMNLSWVAKYVFPRPFWMVGSVTENRKMFFFFFKPKILYRFLSLGDTIWIICIGHLFAFNQHNLSNSAIYCVLFFRSSLLFQVIANSLNQQNRSIGIETKEKKKKPVKHTHFNTKWCFICNIICEMVRDDAYQHVRPMCILVFSLFFSCSSVYYLICST